MNVDFAYYTQEELVTLINTAAKFLDSYNYEKTMLYMKGQNSQPQNNGWWDAAK